MRLRYGTRGSPLALAQSAQAAKLLEERTGVESERVVIATSGDRFSRNQPPDPPGPTPNVKALFVKEIEEALLAGEIDFAVHSAKDLPAELPEPLLLAATPAREDPRDAYIGGPAAPSWESLVAGSTVGTASLRRRIQLARARPGLAFAPLRGNVDTRLRRLAAGEFSGIVLAAAGLRRLGLERVRPEPLPVEVVVPAPGQGALALEARGDEPEVLRLLASINHPETFLAVGCERTLLKALGGGCQTPLGALASVAGVALALSAFWSDGDGLRPVRVHGECAAEPEAAAALAARMAAELLAASA